MELLTQTFLINGCLVLLACTSKAQRANADIIFEINSELINTHRLLLGLRFFVIALVIQVAS
jgi:hypothetical protein